MTTASPTRGFESETPSGIRVYFQAEPKRLYKVNDQEVPSVTEVLKVLEKGGLSWWGMQVGIAGVLEMIERRRLIWDFWRAGLSIDLSGEQLNEVTVENVTELLKQHKLTVNHTLSKAGDRGTSVHRALEVWGEDGTMPDPDFYPEEERGYVVGLVKFLTDLKLSARPLMQMEVMVGSVKYGFAGRYDMSCGVTECELVTKVTPVRGETREVFPKGRWLFDLKTSKSVYESHHLQLAAYELAAVEDGYRPTVGQAVVRVDAQGYYTVTRNRATAEDFLKVKGAYDALTDLKARKG